MQTLENRIYRAYKANKKCVDYKSGTTGSAWFCTARKFAMSIKEIKRIVAEEKERLRNG